jgi:hypothetical protein
MSNIERRAVLTLQRGEWPDNLTHGIWRAECMVAWLKAAGIELVDADVHRGAACLTLGEAGMLEVLAREEVAKHRHPPHDLVRALDKLRERIERGQ